MSRNDLMRRNNFDLVRLALASIVVLVHCYDLSHAPALVPIGRWLSARLAVEGFFVISGFLIFASYERCSTLRQYSANRAWRILPAYWLSTAFCLLIAFAHHSFHVGKFLLANLTFLTFLQPNIAGVFSHNPENPAMNGALWTIKIEVMFYVAVPLIVWACRRFHRDVILWALIVLSLIFRILTAQHASLTLQLPGQLSFFLLGALVYYHLDFFKQRGWPILLASALLFAVHAWTGWFVLRPFAIAGLCLGVSLILPQVKGPTRWGDFSYGTYILHYPIVQLMVEAGQFNVHPWAGLLLTVSLVAIAAVLSWNLVEAPSLARAKSARLRAEALGVGLNYPPAAP